MGEGCCLVLTASDVAACIPPARLSLPGLSEPHCFFSEWLLRRHSTATRKRLSRKIIEGKVISADQGSGQHPPVRRIRHPFCASGCWRKPSCPRLSCLRKDRRYAHDHQMPNVHRLLIGLLYIQPQNCGCTNQQIEPIQAQCRRLALDNPRSRCRKAAPIENGTKCSLRSLHAHPWTNLHLMVAPLVQSDGDAILLQSVF